MRSSAVGLLPPDTRTLFIDMDGTLTDLAFDQAFFTEVLPRRYSEASGLALEAADEHVRVELAAIRGTLDWYSLGHLSALFGLDLAALTEELGHGIPLQPGALDFLGRAEGRFRRVLVTNADPGVLALKLRRTGLAAWLDGIVSAHHLGAAKEEPEFYERLAVLEPDCPRAGVLIDDNLRAIAAARNAGLAVVAITRPSLKRPAREGVEGPAVEGVAELLDHL
jgi:GMP/IMP 5'-nucleotidase